MPPENTQNVNIFSQGDRVIVTDVIYNANTNLKGKEGTVLWVSKTGNMVSVEFDDFVSGHNGGIMPRHTHMPLGREGYCWFCPARSLKFLTNNTLQYSDFEIDEEDAEELDMFLKEYYVKGD